MKHLLPYNIHSLSFGQKYHQRRLLGSKEPNCYAQIWSEAEYYSVDAEFMPPLELNYKHTFSAKTFDSLQEAKDALDKYLIDQGFILLSEEQAHKLLLLV